MDFELTDSQKMVEASADNFARRRLAPIAAQADQKAQLGPDVLREMAALGLVGINVPQRDGGAEAGVVAYCLAIHAIARACSSSAVTLAVTNMVAEIIARFGSQAQREGQLRRLIDGTYHAGAFALSEPAAGSDAGSLSTSAIRVPGGFVLEGEKAWITSAPYAGVIVVWARSVPGTTGSRGVSCFLVEQGAPGMLIGSPESKMGLRASSTCSIRFERCFVADDALLGEEGKGFAVAMAALDGGRLGVSAQALGIAEGALEESVNYVHQRTQFGAPLASFQAIRLAIADSRTELDAGLWLCLRAADLKERSLPFTREASMSKVFCTEAAQRVCDRALQSFGAMGYVSPNGVERRYRDIRVTRIYEGTSEIQRIVIARSLLAT